MKKINLSPNKLGLLFTCLALAISLVSLPRPLVLNYKETIKTNLGEILDPNFYFFQNHPRERGGIEEKAFLHPLFLLPFLFGLPSITPLIFFSYLIPAFFFILFTTTSPPPLALLPFFIVTISLGILRILKRLQSLHV